MQHIHLAIHPFILQSAKNNLAWKYTDSLQNIARRRELFLKKILFTTNKNHCVPSQCLSLLHYARICMQYKYINHLHMLQEGWTWESFQVHNMFCQLPIIHKQYHWSKRRDIYKCIVSVLPNAIPPQTHHLWKIRDSEKNTACSLPPRCPWANTSPP